ncbi:permease prefix domain 1-containing protein [Halobacillus sp. HZG1]|uniref:permease prefix domain 1-containing protein n=1 Tax=Halobacillus sp. HZG1 TaxID=3111769 RepID=UPI002DBF55CA|nr:permease prefix domain 1-containing protein [Halobacillus sp. HZG1]MEC3885609.1 permease prefix domain 1-containing protein [Halobacillus sp. HZG1]
MKKLEKHVNQILNQMQSTDDERDEIKEELLAHLKASKQDYINNGETEKRAERLAINDFGAPGLIGDGLQETLYPFQRGLLYGIGVATLLLGVFIHLIMTFSFGDPEPVWLFIQLVFGSLVTLVAMNISWVGKYFWSVNTVVFLSALWNGFNLVIITQFYSLQVILFMTYIFTLILLCLIFIVRNSYFASLKTNNDPKAKTVTKISHIMNIIFGVIISTAALFMVWGMLVFTGFTWRGLLPIGVIVAWLGFYKFQMYLIGKRPVLAIFTGLLFMAAATVSPFTILSTFM